MFGGGLNVPVPDVDRTDHLLMLGANPFASNGSLATAPDWPGRLERLVERGGTLVVVDPRRSRTAEMATRVGADPPGRRRLPADGDGAGAHQRGPRRPRHLRRPRHRPRRAGGGRRAVHARGRRPRHRARGRPRSAASPASWPRADTACVYGRIGTTTAEFGTLTSWLVDVLNVLTGNLDRPGGAMFTTAGGGRQQHPRQAPLRPRGASCTGARAACASCPRPSASSRRSCMAEEMDTPGRGPDPRARHHRRQPGAVHAELRPARRRAGEPRVHGVGRHLRQRDDPPRRRDPPGAVARCRRATTTWRSSSSRCATSPTTASRCCPSTTTSPTSGRCWPASPSCSRARAPPPTRRSSTT